MSRFQQVKDYLLRRSIRFLTKLEYERLKGKTPYEILGWHGLAPLPVSCPEPLVCPECHAVAVVPLPQLGTNICMSCNWTPVRAGTLPGYTAPPMDPNAPMVPTRQVRGSIPVAEPVLVDMESLVEGSRMPINKIVIGEHNAG